MSAAEATRQHERELYLASLAKRSPAAREALAGLPQTSAMRDLLTEVKANPLTIGSEERAALQRRAEVLRVTHAQEAAGAAVAAAEDSHQRPVSSLESLDMDAIARLRGMFQSADVDGNGELDAEEFVDVFRHVWDVAGTDDRALLHMFMQIDSDCNGTINFDEFISFMVLHNQVLIDSRDQISQRPPNSFLSPVVRPASSSRVHASGATHVIPLPDCRKVLTASRDGALALWDPATGALVHALNNTTNLPQGAHMRSDVGGRTLAEVWVTSLVHDEGLSTVFVGSADRSVLLYDASSWDAAKFLPYGRLRLAHEPTALGLATGALKGPWGSTALVVGDTVGDVSAFSLSAACSTARGTSAPVRAMALPGASRWTAHDDWITDVQHIIGQKKLVATASLDCTVALSDVAAGRVQRVLRHGKAILTVAHAPVLDLIASAGLDRKIRLWSPQDTKPLGSLEGHAAPVQQLIVLNSHRQLLSLSKDSIVILWDLSTRTALQVLNRYARRCPPRPGPGAPQTLASTLQGRRVGPDLCGSHRAAYGDPHHRVRRTVAVAHSILGEGPALKPRVHCHLRGRQRRVRRGRVRRCAAPRAGMEASARARVDADPWLVPRPAAQEEGTLAVWHMPTGLLTARYRAHGESKLTVLRFDTSARRLMSAAFDGSVRVWNFAAGECLKAAIVPESCAVEVTSLLHVPPGGQRPGLFLFTGSKALCAIVDKPSHSKSIHLSSDREPQERLPLVVEARAHSDDVTAVAARALTPSSSSSWLLVTAAHREMAVWEIEPAADAVGRPCMRVMHTLVATTEDASAGGIDHARFIRQGQHHPPLLSVNCRPDRRT